jgi:murein L,D-transpeptidase YafK
VRKDPKDSKDLKDAKSFLSLQSLVSFMSLLLMLTLPAAGATRIEVHKAKRQLLLVSGERTFRQYRVALGLNPTGAKERAGDRRTPEGSYYVCNKNPHSQFYKSLQISYPGEGDAERGFLLGLITQDQRARIAAALSRRGIPPSNTRLGGDIFIHGRGSKPDWTWGCVALDDPDMLELYNAVPVGTPVLIAP